MKKCSSTQQVLVMAGCMLRTKEQAGEPGRCSPWQYAFDGAATLQMGEILRYITTEKLVSKISYW